MRNYLKSSLLAALLLILFVLIGSSKGVAAEKNSLLVHLRGGFSFTDSSWRFAHPMYGNSLESTWYMDGSSAKGPYFEIGLEYRKKRLGWKLTAGTMPSQVTVNPDNLSLFETRTVAFHSNYFNVNSVYYFTEGNHRLCPFVNGGWGMIQCSGERKNSGTLLNLGTGLTGKRSGRLFFHAGIEGRWLFYRNFRESETMNRTIHFLSPALFLGISARLN